jgi:esterase/lipase
MNKIYLIPGLGENCNLLRYKKLKEVLKKDGYNVVCVNPDWYSPVSKQVFSVEKDAIVIGFSFGAILAYLVVKKYPCKKVIFASMSPIHTFSFKELQKDFRKDITPKLGKELAQTRGTELAKDIKKIKISLKELKTSFITLAGENEEKIMLKGVDFIVPQTKHIINDRYIKCIQKII